MYFFMPQSIYGSDARTHERLFGKGGEDGWISNLRGFAGGSINGKIPI